MIASYAAGERGAREAAREGVAVVVVDAFRASTTIAVLVRKGVRVIPVASIKEAAAYTGADYRIGERGSVKVRGFDFGNSPTEIEAAELPPGATVVLSTTNGTGIIEVARGAVKILAGAFVNARAVADELATGPYGERVAVIGCDWEGRRASEDESAAGAILYRLRERGIGIDEAGTAGRRSLPCALGGVSAPFRRSPASYAPRVRAGSRFLPRREHRTGRPPLRRGCFREPAIEGRWPEGLTKRPGKDPNIRQK